MTDHDDRFDRAQSKEFWQIFDLIETSDLDLHQRIVAYSIWRRMWPGRLQASISKALIMRRTGFSESTVKRVLRDLRKVPFFKVETGGGRGAANKFTATIPQQTLFELSEMLSEKPKTPKKRAQKTGSSQTPFSEKRGSVDARKGVYADPPYIPLGIQSVVDVLREEQDQNLIDEGALRAILLAAAGDSIAPSARQRLGRNLSTPRRWLASGYGLQEDVLPALREIAGQRVGEVQSWDYFSQAVVNAKARREAPLPSAAPPRASSPSHTVVDFAERRRKSLAAAMEMAKEFGFHG